MMFENLKGMAGLAGLMKDLPKIKAKMDEIKMRLGEMTVSAETGGGAVRVTANGLLRVVSINLDQSLIIGLVDPHNPDDRVVAEDLIVGAVNAALQKARELAEREMAAAAGEMGLPLPPGGLSGLIS
ncbi:MAG: YbaB/EbfC family nucleoid-associated protein [Phycisphaerales bacterium]|nr:YbaB/EbfC family nucleoid-associated protein [Planctomycetota bacterium]MCZ6543439.1 YbaB/EbfC family nucleoid-associated protein [Planctomycetota bacterium]MCZ6612382.1 YbaB/EbfC family nucleoid-associated protein [Planctomycetota bacterium]MCZ6810798.1 YbaB/EbfC family nucleoid-associated protein [Planctomycetota bacterium]MCZ6852139.1 YbaB/EbfC family nucleoid-associated protein [Planctomycetota bacterium]